MRRFYMPLSPRACAVAMADAIVGRTASRRLTSVLRIFCVFFLSSGVAVHSPIDSRRKAALRRPGDLSKRTAHAVQQRGVAIAPMPTVSRRLAHNVGPCPSACPDDCQELDRCRCAPIPTSSFFSPTRIDGS
ncbi:TPA: hypothetical protein RJR38_000570 [Burkholderia multivorans]|nr:hypothetical protein [Burkholderia multivorans]